MEVILVNEKDEQIGTAGKMEAHQNGWLHRAFSVFIFNTDGELLLQQRAENKYHSAGLWSNTCCSHPAPGEAVSDAARRRLMEEMGFETQLEIVGDFIYKTTFPNGLQEHEFDHILAGEYSGPVVFDKSEVKDVCYKSMEEIERSLKTDPDTYTSWFDIAFPVVKKWWVKRYNS